MKGGSCGSEYVERTQQVTMEYSTDEGHTLCSLGAWSRFRLPILHVNCGKLLARAVQRLRRYDVGRRNTLKFIFNFS